MIDEFCFWAEQFGSISKPIKLYYGNAPLIFYFKRQRSSGSKHIKYLVATNKIKELQLSYLMSM